INSTFYRPAARRTARDWVSRVEENPSFRFTAKVWQRFTHERAVAWTRAEVRDVRNGFDPLLEAGRLGCILFQFPWSFKADEAGWEWLRDLLAAFDHYPRVVEVRHTSWLEADLPAYLAEQGVGIVNIDQ